MLAVLDFMERATTGLILSEEAFNLKVLIPNVRRYESQIETTPTGSRYPECYDVVTGKPGEDYVRLYDEVKGELSGMGIPFE